MTAFGKSESEKDVILGITIRAEVPKMATTTVAEEDVIEEDYYPDDESHSDVCKMISYFGQDSGRNAGGETSTAIWR